MKLSLMTLTMRPHLIAGEMSLHDVLLFAKENGFNAIEFSMPDYEQYPVLEIRKKLDELSLKASCVNRVHEFASKDENLITEGICNAKKMVDDAVILGAPIVMIVPTREFFTMEHDYKEIAKERIIAGFKEIIRYASPKGITVTFEDFPSLRVPFCRISEVKNLLMAVDGLQLTFDNGNFYPSGDDILDAFSQLWPYIVNVHLKDWEVSSEATNILCADGTYLKGGLHGNGLLDQKLLINALKEKKYDGYIAFEYEGNLNHAKAVIEGVKYLKSIIDSAAITNFMSF